MPLYSAKAGFLFYGTVVVELVFVPFIDVAVEIVDDVAERIEFKKVVIVLVACQFSVRISKPVLFFSAFI